MVGTGDGHKMSHAIIGNTMTHIENHMHVVFLKKQKKFSLLNWNKNLRKIRRKKELNLNFFNANFKRFFHLKS
jgi:hypothetical protein